ncbi:MAG: DUF268 domain-containing protein [Bacteroidales bacterium]|jgi:SAM-dependent methyltransferase|nr:DUF268 domain-containing protein [Bacteroidales bacterium]
MNMKRALIIKQTLNVVRERKKWLQVCFMNWWYISDYRRLRKQRAESKSLDFPFGRNRPILHERYSEAGTMSGGYFHQDLLVARKIFKANPHRHVDIGSLIASFVAHVAVFREIEIFDIRKQENKVPNIIFRQADLMRLPDSMTHCCDSISALHSIEHFGLGRYGDPIDYFGHVKALKNITQMLRPGGIFYFSAPLGKQRIEFNAHRVFSASYLWNLLKEDYDLLSFSYVDAAGCHENVAFTDQLTARFAKTRGYDLGIFELRKKPD